MLLSARAALSRSIEYLRAHGDAFSEQLAFMSEFPRMRPSDVKKEWVAQAMTVNARMHALELRRKDGSVFEASTN